MRWCLTFIFLVPFFVFAQDNFSYKIDQGQINRLGMVNPEMGEAYHSSLILRESPNSETSRPELSSAESTLDQGSYQSKIIIPTGEKTPSIDQSFTGNSFDFRVPNDNSIAISKAGKIVSVINASVNCFDGMGSLTNAFTLNDLAQPLGLDELKYDPRVVYDPDADRFVLVFLNGYTDTTSKVVIAFSATNDPADGWNLYALPGHPGNDQIKSDFPAISITNQHLYITLNTFDLSSGESEFKEGIIWKVDKRNGYEGDLLNYERIDDIAFRGKPFFSLFPVQPGRAVFGPNMFFLGNRGTEISNDSIFLIELRVRLAQKDTMVFTVLKSPLPYSFPPLAQQPGAVKLETNDARISGAFLNENCLQFVATSAVPSTTRSGIFHGIIWNPASQPYLDANILHLEEIDCGYPNIASSATDNFPYAAMINFNFSSATNHPGFACIFYDNLQPYSQQIVLKEGESSVTIQPGKINRWGDYTGIQPKYDEEGIVWASGSYGKNKTHNTWISKVKAPFTSGISTNSEATNVRVYPNPFEENVRIKFSLESTESIRIQLFNATGELVELFSHGKIKAGEHQFSFSTDPLPKGAYVLSITDEKGAVLNTKKLIKQ